MKSWTSTVLPLLLLTAGAIADPVAIEPPFEGAQQFDAAAPEVTYRFIATDNEAIRVQVQTRLDGGKTSWTLVDPNGERRLSGHLVGAGRGAGDTGTIPGVAGTWELRIVHDEADGTYEVSYQSAADAT